MYPRPALNACSPVSTSQMVELQTYAAMLDLFSAGDQACGFRDARGALRQSHLFFQAEVNSKLPATYTAALAAVCFLPNAQLPSSPNLSALLSPHTPFLLLEVPPYFPSNHCVAEWRSVSGF